jgi:hypothetical protein
MRRLFGQRFVLGLDKPGLDLLGRCLSELDRGRFSRPSLDLLDRSLGELDPGRFGRRFRHNRGEFLDLGNQYFVLRRFRNRFGKALKFGLGFGHRRRHWNLVCEPSEDGGKRGLLAGLSVFQHGIRQGCGHSAFKTAGMPRPSS